MNHHDSCRLEFAASFAWREVKISFMKDTKIIPTRSIQQQIRVFVSLLFLCRKIGFNLTISIACVHESSYLILHGGMHFNSNQSWVCAMPLCSGALCADCWVDKAKCS